MASLSDFNQPKASAKLSDFFAGTRKAKPVVNQSTINNLAAQTAALSKPEELETNYSRVMDDLQFGPTSPTMEKVTGDWDAFDASRNVDEVQAIVRSDDYSVEQKEAAIRSLASFDVPSSISRRLAEASIIADSEPDDNDEVEFTRISTAPLLDEVDVYNGMVQQQINNLNASMDPNVLDTVKDFIALMVPFYEQNKFAGLANDVATSTGENQVQAISTALLAMGEGKVNLRSMIERMPIDQRTQLAQTIVKYVTNSSGNEAFDPNKLVALSQLSQMLETGGYSGTDRFIDNLTSAIDDTILFAPVSKPIGRFVGGVAGAFAVGGAGRGAANAIKRYETAVKGLTDTGLAGRIEKALDDTATTLSNTTATGVKAGVQKAAGEVIAENIIRALPEDLPPQVRQDVATAIANKMKQFIPGTDNAQMTEELLTAAKDTVSSRMLTGEAAPAGEAAASTELLQIEFKPTNRSFTEDIDNIIDSTPVDVSKAEIDNFRNMVSEELYKPGGMSIDKIIDSSPFADQLNASQIIDLRQQLGALRTKASQPVQQVDVTAAVFRSNATRDSVKSAVSPTSVGRVYQDTNPGKLRAAISSVDNDQTGRLAKAVFGTSRPEALGSELLPEVHKASGQVRNKTKIDEAAPAPDTNAISRVNETRADIQYTAKEKELTRAQVRDDWRDVVGLVPRTEMSTIEDVPTGTRFNVVYGPKDGGFKSAQQAVDQVRFGLRKYGVVDSEIEVLVRDATGYRVANATENLGKEGNYLVRVKHNYEFASTDVRNFENLKGSWWKFADIRIPGTSGKAGGITQHLVPSSAIINKTIINAASVASDRSAFISKRLLELGREYGDLYKALPKEQKYLVDTYILEANDKGLKFDPMRLSARGMTDQAVETVRTWKKNWDTIWHFENADAVVTLRNKGYEKLVGDGTDLIVKPLARNQVAGNIRVYTTEEGGKFINMTKEDVTKLYETGGSIAQSRAPLEIGDDVAEFVIVKQDASSYTRRLNTEDTVLAYRDGYYTVRYDQPFFLTKKMRDKNGKEFEKAIATSGTRVEAERELARLRSTDAEGSYDFRQGRDAEDYSNLEWSSTVASGRTSQKVRGQRLKNISETNPDLNYKHMDSPEESLVKSIQSVSNRTAFRPFLDASKARWMKQFSHLLSKKNMWPEDVNLIGKGSASGKLGELSDAIQTWRYLDSVESGYSDLLDDLSKTFFKGISDVSGRAGWQHIESASRKAEQFDINAFARRKAFRLLLSSNPIRQLPVQMSQALPVILSQNAGFILSGRLPGQMALVSYMRAGGDVSSFFKSMTKPITGLSVEEARSMIKAYEDSGIEDFVSAHTYMRDHINGLVNRKASAKIGAAVGRPLDALQKIGFETGENVLMTSIWLSEYDKARRAGVAFDQEVLANLTAKVRHLTGNMNRAGEMPYNQNMLSGVMQFFGTPHKIFAQVFMGHTGLTGVERAKLGAAYALTYGTGAGIVTDQVLRLLPPDTDAAVRETVENGFANMALNNMLSTLYEEKVSIAFTDSFRIGVAQPNVFQFWEDMMALNIPALIAGSPSGAYVFGDNPKFNQFVRQSMRPFTVNDERRPQEMMEAGKAFLNMFSGASNFMKAQYILEHQQKMGSTGRIVADDLNPMYALMQLAGFSSMEEVQMYALQEKVYKTSSKPYDDVKSLVTEVSRRLSLEGINNQEIEYWMGIMAEAQRVWGNDPFYNEILMKELSTRTKAGDGTFFDAILKATNYVSEDDLEDLLRKSALPNETKDALRESARIVREYK